MSDEKKIYSVELKWRDKYTLGGQYIQSERHGEYRSETALLFAEGMLGKKAEQDGVRFEVEKSREFDTWDEYYKAREEGFKTYDDEHFGKKESAFDKLKRAKESSDKSDDISGPEVPGE